MVRLYSLRTAGAVRALAIAVTVVIDTGRRFADPDSVRDWVDSEVTAVDGRITVRSERATDDGVVLTVDFESSGFSGSDLTYTFTTRGDRVANLTLG
jgi:hypothetical protein